MYRSQNWSSAGYVGALEDVGWCNEFFSMYVDICNPVPSKIVLRVLGVLETQMEQQIITRGQDSLAFWA